MEEIKKPNALEEDGKESKLRKIFESNPKEGIEEIANYISEKHHLKTFVGTRDDQIYIFQDGLYTRKGAKILIKKMIKKILRELMTSHYTREIIEKIKINTSEVGLTKEEFASHDKDLICINNGILNLKTRELKPHNPEVPFLSKIPVDYDEAADCPKIKKFLEGVFFSEDIPVIQEWIGYCLVRDYKYKKALLLEGERDSGKSQFLNVLGNFIGEENISGVGLQEMYKNFSKASLYGKLVNSCDDLSFRDVKETGNFKMATGGGSISAEHKFQDNFHFRNFAKLVFATNQIPQIVTNDDAYYSRWIILQCTNSFKSKDKNTVPNIGDKISTEEELSGLLNYALDGLDRLEENQGFSYDRSVEEVKSLMQRSGSSLAAYIQDRLEEKKGSFITKKEFYNAYEKYTAEKNTWCMSKMKVGRELNKGTTYIRDGEAQVGTKHVRVWRNVQYKNKEFSENNLEKDQKSTQKDLLNPLS